MNLPRGYLSNSQINCYLECPLKYYFVYIENRILPINDYIFLGSVFHSAAEYYFQEKIKGKSPDAVQCRDFLDAAFYSQQQEEKVIWSRPAEKVREIGLAFIEAFAVEIGPKCRPMMVEQEIIAEVPGSDLKLKGIIDLIEEDFTLVDLKTSSRKWNGTSGYRARQMYFYKFLFEQSFSSTVSKLRFEVLSGDPRKVLHQSIPVDASAADVQDALEIALKTAADISAGLFPARESCSLRYCEFRAECRKKNDTSFYC